MDKIPKIDRQREHQANERTFLAWLRTSIALISFGFAIARFGIFLRQLNLAITQQEPPVNPLSNSENLGLALVFFGILTVALAAWRYNKVFWQIEQADYRPNRLMVWIMTAVVIILGLLSIPLLLRRDKVFLRSPSGIQPQSRNLQRSTPNFNLKKGTITTKYKEIYYQIPDFFKKSGI
jgi:putative membrane protein